MSIKPLGYKQIDTNIDKYIFDIEIFENQKTKKNQII